MRMPTRIAASPTQKATQHQVFALVCLEDRVAPDLIQRHQQVFAVGLEQSRAVLQDVMIVAATGPARRGLNQGMRRGRTGCPCLGARERTCFEDVRHARLWPAVLLSGNVAREA